MIKRVRLLDADGNVIEDENAICPDGGRIHIEVRFADGEENYGMPLIHDRFGALIDSEFVDGKLPPGCTLAEIDADGAVVAPGPAPATAVAADVMARAAPDPREAAHRAYVERLSNPKANLGAHHPRAVRISDAVANVHRATQPIDTSRLSASQLAHMKYVQRLEGAYRNR